MASFPAFSATARRLPGSELSAEVTLRFDAPLDRAVEMPAGTSVALRGSSPNDRLRLVTSEAVVLSPPAIVALEGARSTGATEDLLPRARRGLSLGFPLRQSSEGGQGIRIALGGRLVGAVLRIMLWSTPDGALGAPESDVGSWEVWSDSDLAWLGSGATRGILGGAELQGVEQSGVRAEALQRPGPRTEELILPHSSARLDLRRPSRWWLRMFPLGSAAGYVGVVRAVSVEVQGVVVGAHLVSESGPAAIDPASVSSASPAEEDSRAADSSAGSAEAPRPAASARMVAKRLPFRLVGLPR